MSENNSENAYARGPGIPKELADAARAEILQTDASGSKPSDKPVTFITASTSTRAASTKYLNDGDKTALARMLNVEPSQVTNRFRAVDPGICNDLESEHHHNPRRPDFVYSIVALGDMSPSDLPALGDAKTPFELKSGEALHFLGDVPQTWSGKGGGTLLLFHWRNLR